MPLIVSNIKPCRMRQAHKSPCEKTQCGRMPSSTTQTWHGLQTVCLPPLRLSSMGTAGSYSVLAVCVRACACVCVRTHNAGMMASQQLYLTK